MTTLEELLGLDPSSPAIQRAELLADNDRALLRGLVQIRKERGLSQAQVGALMGITQPSVADFEAHDSNPTLAKIRRYAHAVQALIVHRVEVDEGQLLDEAKRDAWVATSIKHVPLSDMAEMGPRSEPVIHVPAPGAARFRSGTGCGSVDFALAA